MNLNLKCVTFIYEKGSTSCEALEIRVKSYTKSKHILFSRNDINTFSESSKILGVKIAPTIVYTSGALLTLFEGDTCLEDLEKELAKQV